MIRDLAELARVTGGVLHGAERGVRAAQHAAGHARQFGEVADHASSPSASSTTARSLNGRVSVPTIW